MSPLVNKPTDWFKDPNGNYIYDPALTMWNAPSRLKEGEEYLGQSLTITMTDSKGLIVCTIQLKIDGTVSASGPLYDQGSFHFNLNSGSVEIDPKFESGGKIYAVDENYIINDDPLFENNNMKQVFTYRNRVSPKGISYDGYLIQGKWNGWILAERYFSYVWSQMTKPTSTPYNDRKNWLTPSGVSR